MGMKQSKPEVMPLYVVELRPSSFHRRCTRSGTGPGNKYSFGLNYEGEAEIGAVLQRLLIHKSFHRKVSLLHDIFAEVCQDKKIFQDVENAAKRYESLTIDGLTEKEARNDDHSEESVILLYDHCVSGKKVYRVRNNHHDDDRDFNAEHDGNEFVAEDQWLTLPMQVEDGRGRYCTCGHAQYVVSTQAGDSASRSCSCGQYVPGDSESSPQASGSSLPDHSAEIICIAVVPIH